MTCTPRERALLRDLAQRVKECAASPVMAARRRQWVEHNSLRSKRPMMLVFPEGAWFDLMPDGTLTCESKDARLTEWHLRARLYQHEHFADDTVLEPTWTVGAVVRDTGWGLNPQRHDAPEARGAWGFDPVLKERADLKKLRYPELIFDEQATNANRAAMHDLFGDILTIVPKGCAHISFHLTNRYIQYRGLTEMMLDMADEPEFAHELLAFFAEGERRRVQALIDLNLLSLNNDDTYQNSGGNGYTDQLPAPGFNPQRVRPADMWASAEAQELAQVSPEMHAEFPLRYEKELLAPFGLTGYGCCEDLTRKLPDVFAIPHIRRISISPFADVEACAAQLKGNYIFSWKAHPAHLVGVFDGVAVRAYIEHAVLAAKANGCVLEMILKDTHTCEQHPERFDEWTRIAREVIESNAS